MSFAAAIIVCVAAFAQNAQYETYFTPDRLRIDLTFAGDASHQQIFLEGLTKEGAWSGSKTNLIDPFRYGEDFMEVQTPSTHCSRSGGPLQMPLQPLRHSTARMLSLSPRRKWC